MSKKVTTPAIDDNQLEVSRSREMSMTNDKHLLRAEKYHALRIRVYRSPIRNRNTTVSCPVPVEQRFAKEYNKKANGHPASDISRLISSSSALEVQNLVNKFVSASNRLLSSQKMTVEQMYLSTKPRFVDTPFEREKYFEYVNTSLGLGPDDLFRISTDYAKSQESPNSEPSN